MPVFTLGIVRDCFYLLIFYFEKFSTWVWRLPFAVNVNLNLSIMLLTTWLTILLSLGKEAASNINVWQLFCSKYVLRKGRSRSTLCNDVCYSKNRNKDVALCFWLTLDHNSRRGFSTKFYMGRLRPEVQPLNPFTYHFWQTRYSFLYFPLTNGLFQHTSLRNLHPFFFFYCYKCTTRRRHLPFTRQLVFFFFSHELVVA